MKKIITSWISGLVVFLSKLLGSFHWTPAPWMVAFSGKAGSAMRWLAGRKRLSIGILVAFLCVAVFGVAGHRYWKSRPRPERLVVHGQNPPATPIHEAAKPSPLTLQFSGSAARLADIGKVVKRGITLSPPLAGEWRWDSDRILQFTPSNDWPVGEKYVVRFEKSFFPAHVHLEEYQFHFESAPFLASLDSIEFFQDSIDPKIKRIEATLSFSHPVDTTQLAQQLELVAQGGRSHPFTVTFDKLKGHAYVHSAPVSIPPEDVRLTLTLKRGTRAAKGGPGAASPVSKEVVVPGMYNYFRINDAALTLVRNEQQDPNQVLIVTTSTATTEAELQKHLSLWLLPQDLAQGPDHGAVKNFRWSQYGPERIGTELLKERVELKPIPTATQFSSLHSYSVQVPPERYLLARVAKGCTSFGGYVLAKDFGRVVQVPSFPREVKVLHEGALMALSGDKKLSVLARGMDALRFEVARVLPNQIQHLVSQTRGSFASPLFDSSLFTQENLTERVGEVRPLERSQENKAQYAAFDLSPYLTSGRAAGRRGLFFFGVQGWDVANRVPVGEDDHRLVLITDLGLLVKDNADGTHEVFIQSLGRGTPVAGVKVEVLGKNGISLIAATTDAQGHALFPKLSDFQREKTPTVYLAQKADDLSFIPFQRGEQQLNFSRFEVGGVTSQGKSEKLNAYLFSDRGLYRPGDPFHVGFIVKAANWAQSLAGVPLEASVMDPRGLEVHKQKFSLTAAGFDEVSYQTEETSPTGTYQVSLYVVKDQKRSALLGNASVRVEEFLPDRMKITSHFSTERAEGWVSPERLKGLVSLKNLFGTPAEKRRITANITLLPSYPAFRGYKEYVFFDPLHAKKSFSEPLKDVQTDEKGEAELELGLERYEKATYQLLLHVEGYEATGGRGVSSESSVLVSPLPQLMGYKADGDLHYLDQRSKHSVQLIALSPSLAPIEVTGLKAHLIELRYVSTLVLQPNGTYKYESVHKEIPLRAQPLAIPAAGLSYALPTENAGDYVLVVRNKEDTDLTRIEFSVRGTANVNRSLDRNAELQVKLKRPDYSSGDNIEMEIKAPYTGAGLITIERDHVYAFKWFQTATTSSVQTIRVPPGVEGNAYVNVSFVRALDSREIFMSPLSYAVMPFSISLAKRVNRIELTSPELARPGEAYKIRYKGTKPGKAVVFAVDEGILQVAAYRTPDPLGHFFRKRALEVTTSQILDQLLPEFSVAQALSASGGDAEAKAALAKNLNPFKRKTDKPVAYWSGIVDIDSTERELVYAVPDHFSGTLRVMAVAVSRDALGAVSKQAIVRGPFVLSPNVPTFVTPGDEFEIGVGVANNVEGSGQAAKVDLSLKTSSHLEVLDGDQRSLSIGEGRESSATFRVRAKNQLGSAHVAFTASLGERKSKRSVDLSLRPASPYSVSVVTGSLKARSVDVPVARRMHPSFRTLEVSASAAPLGLARGLLTYLNQYPYGCTEQLVSQAFPAIVLRHRPELGLPADVVEANLGKVIRVLRGRQNAEGAFGFWAANSYVSDFQTAYAVHFLTEAKEKGYPVPAELLTRGLAYLRSLLGHDLKNLESARTQAYAVYLLTRNGLVSTSQLAALREQLETKFKTSWKSDILAAYLAGAHKLLRQDADAFRLWAGVKGGKPLSSDELSDSLLQESEYLYLMARHFPERLATLPEDSIARLLNEIAGGRYNTLSSAYTILALDAYVDALGDRATPQGLNAALTEVGADGKRTALSWPSGLFPKVAFSDKAAALRLGNESATPLFYQVTQAGFDVSVPSQSLSEKIEVQREYRTPDGKQAEVAELGKELEVHLKLRAVDKRVHFNVAAVDLLPGGFEVVLNAAVNQEMAAAPEESHSDEEPTGEDPDAHANDSNAQDATGSSWRAPFGTESSTWTPDYAELREDRVVLFGIVGPEVREFVYRIKATNVGSYAVPPAFAESMYDRTVKARALAGRVTVKAK